MPENGESQHLLRVVRLHSSSVDCRVPPNERDLEGGAESPSE